MGSIPFKRGVRIVEPKQDAIIAWNGKEQLLYLQTTLAASEKTKVLEVMPLPGRPTVEASNSGVFSAAPSSFQPHQRKREAEDRSEMRMPSAPKPNPPRKSSNSKRSARTRSK